MKKFECKGCELHCELTPKETCLLPKCCPFAEGYEPAWHEVKEEEQKSPKLTAEVFDRPDCPNWANYAVINHHGRLSFFGDKPKFEGEDYGCWSCDNYKYTHINNAFFDPSDWQNSLIERPTKVLPDWVKVDSMGWHKRAGYFKITYVDDVDKRVNIQQVDDESKGYLSFNTVCNEAKYARPRPFNAEEMQKLVGKTIKDKIGNICLISTYLVGGEQIGAFLSFHNAEQLMKSEYTIDGKPCVIYEHLEDGVWIQ
jgi:hypothetical protein